LPLGAGLGSSAAFSVALAAALLQLRLRLFGGAEQKGGEGSLLDGLPVMLQESCALVDAVCPGKAARTLINGWAYAAECILHGAPSGLDNQVSCMGGAIRHVREAQTKRFDVVKAMPALRVLITNTHVPRSTRAIVGQVAALHTSQPEVTTRIFEAIGAITERFLDLTCGKAHEATATDADATATLAATATPSENTPISNGTAACVSPSDVKIIGSLVRMNHHLLCSLGVGCAALEQAVDITHEEGLHTKLTGAGGGGCTFTVLGSAYTPLSDPIYAATMRARTRLEARGFNCFETQVGGHGALWHVAADHAN